VINQVDAERLTLSQADQISNYIIDLNIKNNFKPVSIFVIDNAANIIVRKTMDGSPVVGIPEIAYAKA